MLYILLTEAIEGIWAIAHLTWKGGNGIYNWYYQIPSDNIEDLKKRLNLLEKKLENKD